MWCKNGMDLGSLDGGSKFSLQINVVWPAWIFQDGHNKISIPYALLEHDFDTPQQQISLPLWIWWALWLLWQTEYGRSDALPFPGIDLSCLGVPLLAYRKYLCLGCSVWGTTSWKPAQWKDSDYPKTIKQPEAQPMWSSIEDETSCRKREGPRSTKAPCLWTEKEANFLAQLMPCG